MQLQKTFQFEQIKNSALQSLVTWYNSQLPSEQIVRDVNRTFTVTVYGIDIPYDLVPIVADVQNPPANGIKLAELVWKWSGPINAFREAITDDFVLVGAIPYDNTDENIRIFDISDAWYSNEDSLNTIEIWNKYRASLMSKDSIALLTVRQDGYDGPDYTVPDEAWMYIPYYWHEHGQYGAPPIFRIRPKYKLDHYDFTIDLKKMLVGPTSAADGLLNNVWVYEVPYYDPFMIDPDKRQEVFASFTCLAPDSFAGQLQFKLKLDDGLELCTFKISTTTAAGTKKKIGRHYSDGLSTWDNLYSGDFEYYTTDPSTREYVGSITCEVKLLDGANAPVSGTALTTFDGVLTFRVPAWTRLQSKDFLQDF